MSELQKWFYAEDLAKLPQNINDPQFDALRYYTIVDCTAQILAGKTEPFLKLEARIREHLFESVSRSLGNNYLSKVELKNYQDIFYKAIYKNGTPLFEAKVKALAAANSASATTASTATTSTAAAKK